MDYTSHPKLQLCAHAILAGGCVAYPTEAVWGLGCDPFNRHAVETILRLKTRPVSKGLILISGCAAHFDFLLNDMDSRVCERIHTAWPGHVTWLVPHRGCVPEFVSGDSDKVAIRFSAHPVVRALSQRFGGAIVSTSANPAGLAPALNATDARRYFGNAPLLYAPGTVGKPNRPSRIIDALSGQTLRA